MKKYLVLFFLLASLTSFGQFSNYTNINGRYKWIAGKFDSTFTIPSGTTPSLRVGGGTGPGALFYSTTDSTVYQYTGTRWTRLRGTDTAHVVSAYVRNTTASTMTAGQVVYINGSTGTTPTIALAVNTADSTSAMTFGFVRGTIAPNAFGWITSFGPLEGVNTNAYTEGEVIYLDSIPGQFTHDKPQAPYHMVTLGYIVKKSGGNGTIFAKIQNGYELDELHNVKITGPVLNKSVIIYDSVNQLWVDTTVSAAGLGLGGSGTTNYLSKWTSSSALGNSLVFDNGTNVGINNTSPSERLDISGNARISGGIYINSNARNWGSNMRFIQLGSGGSINNWSGSAANLYLGSNLYDLGTGIIKRINNGSASFYSLEGNIHTWGIAPNGSADANITFSTVMQIPGTGNVLINTTTDAGYRLDVSGTFRSTGDANINGLTVGKGGGSVATNTAVGFESINGSATGTENAAFGYRALKAITTANGNTAVGVNSSVALTTGSQNTTLGYNTGAAATTAGRNTLIGYIAGQSVTSDYNTIIGWRAGSAATSGSVNTLVGADVGLNITTGSNNNLFGSSITGITTGSNNTIIGANVTGLSASLSNTIILADGQGNQRLYINNTGLTGIGITSPANALHIDRGTATASYLQFTAGTTTGQLASDGFEVGIDASGNGVINQQENLPMLFYTNNTERMRIQADGNITIGGTLGIGGVLNTSYNLSTINILTTGGTNLATNSGSLGIGTTSSNIGTWNRAATLNSAGTNVAYELAIGNVFQAYFAADASNVYLASYANKPLLFRTNNADVARFTTAGRLLIGTTTESTYLLDVNGTARVGGTARNIILNSDIYGGQLSVNTTNASGYTSLFVTNSSGVGFRVIAGASDVELRINNAYRFNAVFGGDFLTMDSYAKVTFNAANYSGGDFQIKGQTNNNLFYSKASTDNIGLGTSSPNASALLDVSSTTKGFLPPRMTNAQMLAITTPAAGLVVYDTTNNKLNVYDGTNWVTLH